MPSYAARRAASLARPSIDMRPFLRGATRDQGPRPLCVPISVSGAHQGARIRSGAITPEPLAPEPLWAHCVELGQVSSLGTTLKAVGDALSVHGQPPLLAWPYNPDLGIGTEGPPPSASAAASWYQAQVVDVPLAHDGIESLLEDALAVSLPTVVVIEVTKEFETANSQGVITVPPLDSPAGDYHAVLAVGATTDSVAGLRCLLIRNTWGLGWGAGGYGWLPLDYLIAFAVQAGVVNPLSLRSCTAFGSDASTLTSEERIMPSFGDHGHAQDRKTEAR